MTDTATNTIQNLEYSTTPDGLAVFMRSGEGAVDEELRQPYYVVWNSKRR